MAFKNERRVVEKRTVFIAGEPEAARIISDYTLDGFASFQRKYGCTADESRVLAYAAASIILSAAAKRVEDQGLFDELGVNRIPASPAEPTWTSSTTGESIPVRDLPTPYLVNIIRKYAGFRAGILTACRNELAKRGEREAA